MTFVRVFLVVAAYRYFGATPVSWRLRGIGRVRTAPIPTWVKVAIDAWTRPACVAASHVFRPVNRADRVTDERLGEKVVWQMLRQYAANVGVPGIAPHDLRRTCAKLCRAAGGTPGLLER